MKQYLSNYLNTNIDTNNLLGFVFVIFVTLFSFWNKRISSFIIYKTLLLFLLLLVVVLLLADIIHIIQFINCRDDDTMRQSPQAYVCLCMRAYVDICHIYIYKYKCVFVRIYICIINLRNPRNWLFFFSLFPNRKYHNYQKKPHKNTFFFEMSTKSYTP